MEKKDPIQKYQFEITTKDTYQIVIEKDPRAARILFDEIEGLLAQCDLALYGEALKTAQRWKTAKNTFIVCLETKMDHDLKAYALMSTLPNGTYRIYDVAPVLILSEAPFRLILLQQLYALSERDKVKLLVPKKIKEMAIETAKNPTSMKEINDAFDEAQAKMEAHNKNLKKIEYEKTKEI